VKDHQLRFAIAKDDEVVFVFVLAVRVCAVFKNFRPSECGRIMFPSPASRITPLRYVCKPFHPFSGVAILETQCMSECVSSNLAGGELIEPPESLSPMLMCQLKIVKVKEWD
jgi:hypothetical protein